MRFDEAHKVTPAVAGEEVLGVELIAADVTVEKDVYTCIKK
jgi:hypothetical protein